MDNISIVKKELSRDYVRFKSMAPADLFVLRKDMESFLRSEDVGLVYVALENPVVTQASMETGGKNCKRIVYSAVGIYAGDLLEVGLEEEVFPLPDAELKIEIEG